VLLHCFAVLPHPLQSLPLPLVVFTVPPSHILSSSVSEISYCEPVQQQHQLRCSAQLWVALAPALMTIAQVQVSDVHAVVCAGPRVLQM